MAEVEVVHPSELGPGELRAWASFQAATPELGNPLLSSEFARLVGDLRTDARVAVWRSEGRTAGFLGFHKTLGNFARPLGAPFCDYHALVSAPGLMRRPDDPLAAAGLHGMRLSGLVDPYRLFPHDLDAAPAHRIDLSEGADTYLDWLWEASRNRSRNFKRYSRQLAKSLGPLRIEGPDASPETFERLIAWKRSQLTATGLHDFTTSAWGAKLFRRLFESPDPAFGGLMISLYAGDTPVAAHFGLRRGDWYHPWIGAYDPQLAGFSPGVVHQVLAAEAAGSLGIRLYDLGPHADHYKSAFANVTSVVREGLAASRTLPGRLAMSSERMLAPSGGLSVLGHLRNRWDHVSALEPTLGGRIAGLASAASAIERRIEAWTHAA